MLCIKDLDKGTILKNLNLQVRKGEIALLLGASGVGKSTLLRLICGLDTPCSGSILIDTQPIKKAGFVDQEYFLFEHLTVERNLTIVLEQQTTDAKKKALKLLQEYELNDHATKFASKLSGGQKQRLAIARTIASDPSVLCMDEPTSALDPACTKMVANTILKLAATGLPVVITTHDLTLIEMLQCTIHLIKEGSIAESSHSSTWKKDNPSTPMLNMFSKGEN